MFLLLYFDTHVKRRILENKIYLVSKRRDRKKILNCNKVTYENKINIHIF